jgi:hypothetical protein
VKPADISGIKMSVYLKNKNLANEQREQEHQKSM